MPLTPASLIPESLAAASPPLAFLTLASRVADDVTSLILSFIAPVKLVPTFLASPPAPMSPLFSAAPISLVQVSPILVFLDQASLIQASLVLVFLVQASLIQVSPVQVSLGRALAV